MKKYFTKIIVFFLAITLWSCTEEYLETQPTEFISGERIEEVTEYNPDVAKGQLLGIYSLMYETGTGGTDLDHDDFGQKGYDIYSDLLSGDMVLAGYNYGWYSTIASYTSTTDYTDTDNYKPWRYYYRIILGANSVIDGLGGNDAELATDESKYSMGQAKTMRAFAYFYLSYLYGEEFINDADVLPIYTSTTDPAKPLSTFADVYAFVKDDLEQSVSLLEGFARPGKYVVDKNVAEALLAYVYLTMEEYDKAATAAQNVINNSGYTMLEMDELTSDG
ncbi:MAG TPA: RagB/SusD family nutrient uptake outer membrane protein, partial [Bacteroidales bacterium]|nr:RagB/SusD family nutrient uptake outer membrane protein [Bacteroidales bacterium]